jgi:alkyl hydroperoxide reductase subunit D
MNLQALKDRLPEYARDLRANLGAVLNSEHLTPAQAWGTAVASAFAARNRELLRALREDALPHLGETGLNAAHAAAAIMGMNNVYYRFTHLVEAPEYQQMPARLRMQVMANPGVDSRDFELWSLAVSAVNGCGMCMASHEKKLRKAGVKPEAVQDAVRIAAVVHGMAAALEASEAAV